MFKVYNARGDLRKETPHIEEAEKTARRLGPGAFIEDERDLVANIARGSFPRCNIVTEITIYGGRYL